MAATLGVSLSYYSSIKRSVSLPLELEIAYTREYGESGGMRFLRLSHKNAMHFLLVPAEHLLLEPS